MSLCYHCCDICGMWENGIVGHVIGFCVCAKNGYHGVWLYVRGVRAWAGELCPSLEAKAKLTCSSEGA